MSDTSQVANPGSTLGEAVGALVEREVNRLMRPIAEEYGCVYMAAGSPDPRTGRVTKLLMQDAAGNKFQIDAAIATRRIQFLVLVNSLCSSAEEHDFARCEEISMAYRHLRRVYSKVCLIIVVLVGNWGESSKAILRSLGVSLFEIDASLIAFELAKHHIAFSGQEAERERTSGVWRQWQELSEADYDAIASALLKDIEPQLRETLEVTLNKRVRHKSKTH